MIAARQEGELRPALERLDRIIAASEGIDSDTLTFAFRPLWQLDAATAATIALTKAQTTQVYAGLNLWPVATTARLVAAQLAEDGTYPNAGAVFGKGGAADPVVAGPTLDYDPGQPRDPDGRWTAGGGGASGSIPSASVPLGSAQSREPPIGASPLTAAAEPSGPGTTASSTAADPAVEAIIRQATVTLAPFLATASLRERAAEAVRGLVNNLPAWLTGGMPPDSSPATQSIGPGVDEPANSVAASPVPLGTQTFIQPPKDAYDPAGPKAPGKPGPETGFQDPKGGENWVPNPNGRGYGWEDDKGRVWVPTGQGGSAHGGPHWDVQGPGRRYQNVKPPQDR